MKKQIVKTLSFLTVLAIALSLFISLGNIKAQAAEKKVKLNKKKLTLTTGDWKKLKLKNGSGHIFASFVIMMDMRVLPSVLPAHIGIPRLR